MKLIVTGGAGYIGSVAVEELIKAGHEVVVIDNLSLGHRAAVHPAATLEVGDLSDRAFIDRVLGEHQPEAIMHFAAKSLVGESMQNPALYLGDNVTNGLNLLRGMVDHGVKKFILSSTANLFDEPDEIPITETATIRPGSPYGESKFFMERMLHWFSEIYGLRYACLRYFNAAGASAERGEDHDPELHLIPIVLQVAQGKRAAVKMFGDDYDTIDGTCVRDYIHIIDLAQAHILALEALDKGNCVYNLGNGAGYSVKQVIETAREITGHPIPAEVAPRRAGDPAVLVAGSDKIRRELGWTPRFPELRPIIESAWRWHQAHPRGYQDK